MFISYNYIMDSLIKGIMRRFNILKEITKNNCYDKNDSIHLEFQKLSELEIDQFQKLINRYLEKSKEYTSEIIRKQLIDLGYADFFVDYLLGIKSKQNEKSGRNRYDNLNIDDDFSDLSEILHDQRVMEILHSNLILHDIKHNDHFKNCNTIKDNMRKEKYDIVLSNFPFGRKGGNIFADKNDVKKLMKYYGIKSSVLPLFVVKHTINILTEGGRAGVIVTTGELTNTGKDYNFFREDLVENNTLTKIIILPKGLFENAKGVSMAKVNHLVTFNMPDNQQSRCILIAAKASVRKIIFMKTIAFFIVGFHKDCL